FALICFFSCALLLMLIRKNALPKELAEFLLLLVISYNTSLLYAFAVFFVFWHSWDATSVQIFKLSTVKKGFNIKNWIKEAAPFTILSWAGIGLLLWLSTYWMSSWPLVTLFFILVSIITLPHTIVMSRFYKAS
ncbi:MAG: Brp/Blh family beta-carotene 15,15'-dioxygenase, partial [Cyclobacteriaceae bacterium]